MPADRSCDDSADFRRNSGQIPCSGCRAFHAGGRESFSDKIRTAKQPGPDYLVLECKHNSVNSCEWDYKAIKNWKRSKKYIQQLQNWLAAGEIDTIMVTVPAYVNYAMVQIDERADVFYINSFTL